MFDVISGLPMHPLLVHAAVVLLPVMGVVTSLVVARPAWRPVLRWVVIADAATFVVMIVTAQAGEALQSRLSQATGLPVAHDHGELGDLMAPVALLLAVVALAAMFAIRRGGVLVPVSVVVVTLVGLLALGLTVAVGHSGAKASWQERIADTPSPKDD
jgi:hypothetical protein